MPQFSRWWCCCCTHDRSTTSFIIFAHMRMTRYWEVALCDKVYAEDDYDLLEFWSEQFTQPIPLPTYLITYTLKQLILRKFSETYCTR